MFIVGGNMKSLTLMVLLTIAGCGGGNTLTASEIQPVPVETVSAKITSTQIMAIDITPSEVYFLGYIQAQNTGTIDIKNAYYRVEAEDKYAASWGGFSLIAVTMPFDIYQGAGKSTTVEFTNNTNSVILVTGLVYPREYRIKMVLCSANGVPLDSDIVIVLIP